MNRFYIAPETWSTDNLKLTDREHHHCVHVMRHKEGDRVTVFDGRGNEATAEIAAIDKKEVSLKVQHSAKVEPLPVKITLAQAVPKGKQMELITQKAVELGAAEIVPLLSERTVVQFRSDSAADKKQEKWQLVAIDAAKQCGQNHLPTVKEPVMMKDFLDALGHYDLLLIASLQPDARYLRTVLEEASARFGEGGAPASVLVVVGPEGDFTPAEINLAKSTGFQPITLGPVILRSETAAIYCLSILSYELLAKV